LDLNWTKEIAANYLYYSKLKMYSEGVKIPIAILIFMENNNISYKAYSPANYNPMQVIDDSENTEDTDDTWDTYDENEFDRFLERVYSRINYNPTNPLNNDTHFGKFQELHTRYIDVPLGARGNVVYFSTYEDPNCKYKVIHRESPILFDNRLANDYAQLQNQLNHESCSHEFV
jgi:hypothetical protein